MVPWLIMCYLLGLFNSYLLILVLSVVFEYWCILRFCRPFTHPERSMEVLIHSEPVLFAIVVALLNTWKSNPLSFIHLTQIASVLNNEVLSCASAWMLCHVYIGFSLFSMPFLIYAARKINRLLAINGEPIYLPDRTGVLYRNR